MERSVALNSGEGNFGLSDTLLGYDARLNNSPIEIRMNSNPQGAQRAVLIDPPITAAAEKKPLFGFAYLIKILAATGVTGGVALHFLGHVSNNHYLRMWGLDPGQFPKSLDWASINGYYTLFERLTSIFHILVENWQTLAYLWLGSTVVVLYWFFLSYLSKKMEPEKLEFWLQRHFPKWAHIPLIGAGIGGLMTIFLPSLFLTGSILLAVPGLLGESRGEAVYKSHLERFQKGCEEISRRPLCIEIRKDGKPLAKGFLIDSSESHIALFDVSLQRARVLERAGTEIIADPPKIFNNEKNEGKRDQ